MQTKESIILQEESGLVKEGHLNWFNTSKFPYFDENGNVTGTFGISHEITDRKKLDNEILEKNHQLNEAKVLIEEASIAKTQFLVNISHKMKTPLNSIMGMIDMALETSLDDKQKMLLETPRLSSEVLLKLINDLISVSKLQGGAVESEHKNFNLWELLKDVASRYKNLANQKEIYFQWEISDNAPEILFGNPNGLEQILSNILSNAIKFNRPIGSVTFKLLNAAQLAGNKDIMLNFEISDNGIGISANKMKIIFEDFSKVDNTSAIAYAGIVLSIAKRLIQIMNGRIDVKSHKGEGSTFSFYVMLESGQANEDHKSSRRSPAYDISHSSKKNGKALIVEDNLLNQQVAHHIIKKLNFDSTVVSNGLEALDILEKEKFDFILMDVQMPELNGLETTKRIRSGSFSNAVKTIPIIACSAYENEFECKEAGMDYYVPKPLIAKKLLEVIETLHPD
jgi:signal transduction histidine kinase/CheY-like chemotaxis protein